MANKMLIDASHPEETRVVVLRGNRVEEFDFEAASKKQLRGNIYLAKVTRVEPSLQAAFVEYGGNRHGFLAFSEIHPDYYQIPVADRQALLAEEALHRDDEEDEEQRKDNGRRSRRNKGRNRDGNIAKASDGDEVISGHSEEAENAAHAEDGHGDEAHADEAHGEEAHGDNGHADLADHAPDHVDDTHEAPHGIETFGGTGDEDDAPKRHSRKGGDDGHEAPPAIEHLGGDVMEELPRRVQRNSRKQYKIQEVIKRRQVLLIQVVKEERGNKGAALTTYLSLAGRYSVLMPNTARGGGISRKITNATDRQRLKSIVQDLEVPDGMGVILRTAGAARTKAEVKRDFEYLMRMWETVREMTLQSSAPYLVYEEGSLIKRAIRDLYNKDIDEVMVAGEPGYKEAKDFMRLLMPSHAKNVQPYRDVTPMFVRAGVEAQLDAMFSTQVTLRSGGYIVINQTEALVAIDVNSGRSTREHNIEDTAVRTNLEAAEEVARQLRLRDLAGLIVVDFIDMEENRNNRAVERKMKEALKNDRARIQVGHISHFGLLEMSRQRMRTGVLEGSTVVCPHCVGAGTVRSTASIALHVLRVLEDGLIKNAQYNLIVRTRTVVALYILNQKRPHLAELEGRFGITVTVMADDSLTGSVYHAMERGELAELLPARPPVPQVEYAPEPEEDFIEEIEEVEEEVAAKPQSHENRREGGRRDGGQRHERDQNRERPQRGGSRQANNETVADTEGFVSEGEANGNDARPVDTRTVDTRPGDARPGDTRLGDTRLGEARLGDEADSETIRRKRRRRRRRGRGGDRESSGIAGNAPQPSDDGMAMVAEIALAESQRSLISEVGDSAKATLAAEAATTEAAMPIEVSDARETAAEAEKPKRGRRPARKTAAQSAATDAPEAPAQEPDAPKKRGRAAKPKSEAAADVAVAVPKSASVAQAPEIAAPEARAAAALAAPSVKAEPVAKADPVAKAEPAAPPVAPAVSSTALDPSQPKRGGWWQRAKDSFSGS